MRVASGYEITWIDVERSCRCNDAENRIIKFLTISSQSQWIISVVTWRHSLGWYKELSGHAKSSHACVRDVTRVRACDDGNLLTLWWDVTRRNTTLGEGVREDARKMALDWNSHQPLFWKKCNPITSLILFFSTKFSYFSPSAELSFLACFLCVPNTNTRCINMSFET